jgi:hypothetical protein
MTSEPERALVARELFDGEVLVDADPIGGEPIARPGAERMTASLEERIARVLVASTHPELPARKVDELVRYGVGIATARLVIVDVQRYEASLTWRLDAITALRALVDRQAEDEGCWFIAASMPEAYLQQELRRLHAAVEAIGR